MVFKMLDFVSKSIFFFIYLQAGQYFAHTLKRLNVCFSKKKISQFSNLMAFERRFIKLALCNASLAYG